MVQRDASSQNVTAQELKVRANKEDCPRSIFEHIEICCAMVDKNGKAIRSKAEFVYEKVKSVGSMELTFLSHTGYCVDL